MENKVVRMVKVMNWGRLRIALLFSPNVELGFSFLSRGQYFS